MFAVGPFKLLILIGYMNLEISFTLSNLVEYVFKVCPSDIFNLIGVCPNYFLFISKSINLSLFLSSSLPKCLS